MSFKPSPISAVKLRASALDDTTGAWRFHRHDLSGPGHVDDIACYCSPIELTAMAILSYRVLDLQQLLDSFHAVS